MQRKLIVLAIAGALVAPAAMADGNVSIYGAANMSVDMTKDGAPTNGNSANKVSSNESFFGIKGSTDLGGGYTAVAQIESAIALDGTATAAAGVNTSAMTGSKLAARDSFLGLAGGFGTVLAGTHDTPYKMATRGMDVFANTIADNRNLGTVHDIRLGNVLAYVSPKIANSVTIVGALVMGAENMNGAAAGSTKGSALSLAGMYGAGPINASVAYQTITIGSNNTGTLAANSLGLGAGFVNAKLSAFKVGVGFTQDQFGVNVVLERPTISVAGAASVSQTNLYLGAKFHVSSTDAIKAAYGKAGSTATAGAPANGATQMSIGYDHNLGKGTTVYALYTKVSNNTNGTYGLGQTADGEITGAQPGVANSAPSAISVGMNYAF
jgi:predicted porin